MARKLKMQRSVSKSASTSVEAPDGQKKYALHNLVESVYPVQVFNAEGKVVNIHMRVQGRNGQEPPVILSTQVTPHIKRLVKKQFIRLVEVA